MPLVAACDSWPRPRPESQTLYRRRRPSTVERTTMSTEGGAVSRQTTDCGDVWPAISRLPLTPSRTPCRQRGSADSKTNRKVDPSQHSIASISQTGLAGVDNVEFRQLLGSPRGVPHLPPPPDQPHWESNQPRTGQSRYRIGGGRPRPQQGSGSGTGEAEPHPVKRRLICMMRCRICCGARVDHADEPTRRPTVLPWTHSTSCHPNPGVTSPPLWRPHSV